MNPAVRQLLIGRPAGGTNIWQYTEFLGSNRYGVTNATKGTETINVNGITLTRLTAANFFGSLRSQVGGLGLSPFVTGNRYLVSSHIYSKSADQFVWTRPLANSSSLGHGAKWLQQNTLRRIWTLTEATSTSALDFMPDPAVELGSGAGVDTYWIFQGTTEGAALDLYIGGFQIEPVSSAYKDGIAMIGDSTMEGASGDIDSVATNAREISVWLGALLNVPVFNRATAGDQTATMDARWATDITPLAVNCKYVVIQGGVNDFANSVALATVQTNIASMVAKAEADGLLPVLFTCTPSTGIVDVPADEANRLAFNAWLKATYPRVVDIATAVADPANPSALNPAWAGDGVHYTQAGKQAAARLAAQSAFWDFRVPSRYRRVIGLP